MSQSDAETPKSAVEAGTVYYDPEMIAALKHQFESVSPETWHRMMNPLCGGCLVERGQNLLRAMNAAELADYTKKAANE